MNANVTIYISIPIKYSETAQRIELFLSKRGFNVLNPCNIVPNSPKEDLPTSIANECWRMINDSSIVVLYADYYGLDCAAELGYSIAKSKAIFPISFSGNISLLDSNWMVKSSVANVSYDLETLADNIINYMADQRETRYQNGHHRKEVLVRKPY